MISGWGVTNAFGSGDWVFGVTIHGIYDEEGGIREERGVCPLSQL